MDSSQSIPQVLKSAPKKKTSKGYASSSSIEPFLRDTTHLFSLDPMDYDDSIRVMIEFISRHPISVPLTKIPDPPLPFRLLHTAFERIRIEDDILETVISDDRIVAIHK